MPRRPVPPAAAQVDPGWVAAQRREDRRLRRPPMVTCASCAALAALMLALGLAGVLNAALTALGTIVSGAAAAAAGRELRRGRQDLRERIAAEHRRIEKIRAVQQSRLAARQEQHARQVRSWQASSAAFGRQPQWYAVSLPAEIDRLDVAGGTLAGWSALLTMIAAPRLSAGGDVTVLDLTEGAVARDLLAVARRIGIQPLVWVLPGDLPRLDLGTGLGREATAEVLAAAVAASDDLDGAATGSGGRGGPGGSPLTDAAILDRVLGVLGAEPGVAVVTAALRALGQAGDPRDDLRAGRLTADQLERITALFGRGAADRVVIERAWAMESRLRALDQLGSGAGPLPPTRLRVASLDRRAGPAGNRVLGSYLAVALTQLLRQVPRGRRWQQTLCLLGAERLPGDALDRLADACEVSGTGLVLAYRTIPGQVKARLGRGNAAVAFMRLGNAEDARVAMDQIGTEHRFVVSQLTDTVGTSVTDTAGDSYTSTVGTADSVSESASVSQTSGRSRGTGSSRQDAFAPFGNFTGSRSRDTNWSAGTTDSVSLTAGVNAGTSWGVSTSRAAGTSSSLARSMQRSREFLVEQHQLQQLPPSAVLVSYASPEGRQVTLADANPGIIALRTSTLLSLEEARADGPATAAPDAGAHPHPHTRPWPDQPSANLGPPPERLDWRKRRS